MDRNLPAKPDFSKLYLTDSDRAAATAGEAAKPAPAAAEAPRGRVVFGPHFVCQEMVFDGVDLIVNSAEWNRCPPGEGRFRAIIAPNVRFLIDNKFYSYDQIISGDHPLLGLGARRTHTQGRKTPSNPTR